MNYIYENNNSICAELCDEIIYLFEKNQNKYDGHTLGGVDKKIKDTTDLIIDKSNKSWTEIYSFLESELTINIKKYLENNNNKYIKTNSYEPISKNLTTSTFMVQRYIQNEGKYIYHNDFHVDYEKKSYRVLTYLFYLNDVVEGGETEFFAGDIKIIPKKGKLILFPSSWTFPHCGKMPISSNKYIITGWIYESKK
jgi:Rps23 Pro-64 3,4-dihydroxylase Tpa1-like proline 4-hydroxylase